MQTWHCTNNTLPVANYQLPVGIGFGMAAGVGVILGRLVRRVGIAGYWILRGGLVVSGLGSGDWVGRFRFLMGFGATAQNWGN